MLDLLEKNRNEDLRRLVTPEYLQDKIKTLEGDFKIRFEERFNLINQSIESQFKEVFQKCTSLALARVSKQDFENNFEAMRIDLRQMNKELEHAVAMAEYVYQRAQQPEKIAGDAISEEELSVS